MTEPNLVARRLIDDTRNKFGNIHSWRDTYEYFRRSGASFKEEEAALRLAFYLASWGMFRGSANARNYGAIAFIPLVRALRHEDSLSLCGIRIQDGIKRVDELFDLFARIENAMRAAMSDVSVTDTLKTKIALGALGCVPAYDRYFILGAKTLRWPRALSKKSLFRLLANASADPGFQQFKRIVAGARMHLPDMRLLDAYLNYRGLIEEGR
jgi:hypothetical protein